MKYLMVRNMTYDEWYFDKGVVAIGWGDINFSKYNDADSLIEKMESMDPNLSGKRKTQIRRFIEIKKGDRILVPWWDYVCLAVAEGNIIYDKTRIDDEQSNQQVVKYLKNEDGHICIPRKELKEGLQRRLRVPGQFVSDLEEFEEDLNNIFNSAIGNKTIYTWNDQYIDHHGKKMDEFKTKLLTNIREGKTKLQAGGVGLEDVVRELLEKDGYNAIKLSKRLFPEDADADILATKSDRFIETNLLVQVKHHRGYSDDWGIDQLLKIKKLLPEDYKDHSLVFVTSADVEKGILKKAENNGISIIDGKKLIDWIIDDLDKISEETKKMLGIIFIPQTL